MAKNSHKSKGNNKRTFQKKNTTKLSVTGFTGTSQQLVNWLSRAGQNIKKNIFVNGNNGTFTVSVSLPNLVEQILRLNGDNYDNSIVSICEMQQQPQATSLQSVVKELISRCYTAGDFSINLDNLQQKLQALGYQRNFDNVALNKIFELIALSKPALKAVHYCNNNLTSLVSFKNLGRLFPSLMGLDLTNNSIRQIDQLDHIKDLPLEVLTLLNNPITQDPNYLLIQIVFYFSLFYSTSSAVLKEYISHLFSQIRTYFKKIRLLDQKPLGTAFQFPISISNNLPSIEIGYFASFDIYSYANGFLTQYFELLDKNPGDLIRFYSPSSIFSLTLSDGVATFLSTSNRNHANQFAQNEYVSRLYIGPKIAPLFVNKFEHCTHKMNNIAFDVCQIQIPPLFPTVLNITAFGKCELNSREMNFYRTFILTPDNIIINEHLHLFKGDIPFVVVQQTKDAIDAINNVSNLTKLSVAEVLPFLKSTNYDSKMAVVRMTLVLKVMGSNFTKEQAGFICEKLQWNEQYIGQGISQYGSELFNKLQQI
ncbi:mRNA export factor mex67, putative [Entamoeba histolytica HM-3:IMSS]|uniref:NTF2 domain-containing protein n=6 Tax=Entamoeba histolytica TaxID=5759 RepID=C4LXY0_ENTH1|nr:hypothetical protein EHI_035490 [Entamoeba histolytica HM-1:IMSS]EMD43562.1 mRNA export factor mex67, putative [Entamoeba histolytica KU27]EMS13120.1 mRNA export factor mex67, putative [Entamoeba histolytica HM-3:IMSS]ENY64211.1 mRNA export factor mex67, putative [Entamoeba histolytica HM-1:IMSS-A]GAT93635.1 hypothetical protein CL6EHI_035490 [Entamoeba histolytica]EAL50738.2 hypothetical protein EHI_035490 [Entamoeba histolytica HM-1:IMSS]|eukprot:XP_656124.2 hypothetical protein EHI_035490 [Entamoeba histolytica HM-1:IMSS]